MNFNNYLKYVKGHGPNTNSDTLSFTDRFMMAFGRRLTEVGVPLIDKIIDSDFYVNADSATIELAIESDDYELDFADYNLKIKFDTDLFDDKYDEADDENIRVKVTYKKATSVNDTHDLDPFVSIEKKELRTYLTGLMSWIDYAARTGIVFDDQIMKNFLIHDNELSSYVQDGISRIGIKNIKLNILVITAISLIEKVGFFDDMAKVDVDEYLDDDEDEDGMVLPYELPDEDEDIPEEYRSAEPGPAAHPDDGNTKADSSAESGI